MGSSAILPLPGQPGPMHADEFQAGSVPNITSFAFEKIAPPSPLYITRDDVLIVEGASIAVPTTITFAVRLLLPYPPLPGQPAPTGKPFASPIIGGPAYIALLVQSVNMSVGFTTVSATIPLAEGFLLSIGAITSAFGQRGETFARAHLIRGGSVLGTPMLPLFADYVSTIFPSGWPNGRLVWPHEGPGAMTVATVANPAAGVDWVYTQPNNTRARVVCFTAQLVTSATVAARIVRLRSVGGGGIIIFQSPPNQTIAASTTTFVSAAQGQITSTTDSTTVSLTLPGDFRLDPNNQNGPSQVGVSTSAIQAADQWSNIRVVLEQWLTSV